MIHVTLNNPSDIRRLLFQEKNTYNFDICSLIVTSGLYLVLVKSLLLEWVFFLCIIVFYIHPTLRLHSFFKLLVQRDYLFICLNHLSSTFSLSFFLCGGKATSMI